MKINKMKKWGLLLLPFLFLAHPASAVCPVCIIAVGSCMGLSRYFGVDDIITGIWIGGLIVSAIIWTIDWLNRKNIKFYGRKILIVLTYYFFVFWPMQQKGITGHPFNKLWGIDKLVLGIILGSIYLVLANALNLWLKKRNNDKVYFPFQKVAIPVATLFVFSVIFYFITC